MNPRRRLRIEALEDRRLFASMPELLKNINPNSASSVPLEFVEAGSITFFTADDGINGRELWKTDGTSAGTSMVKDIRVGTDGSFVGVSDVGSPYANVNGVLFFRANDGANGVELWKSDGTSAGTVLVKDIFAGIAPSSPREFTNVNGTLFFTAVDSLAGTELWRSDGTASGTVRVKDIRLSGSGFPRYLTNVNGTLFFTATDGTSGDELWKSNGTDAGTVRVKDINPIGNATPRELTNVSGTLFFNATDGISGYELWKSDGTDSGTVRVKDIRPVGSAFPSNLTNVNGTLFFRADDGASGDELWKSDGTPIGTVRVQDIRLGTAGSSPLALTNVNGTLFFVARDDFIGQELWKSDGTQAGTVVVRDIRPGFNSSNPFYLTNVNDTLYFVANDGSTGGELWKSNGTPAGTVLVKDINLNGSGLYPHRLASIRGNLFFSADNGVNGVEPWILRHAPNTNVLQIFASSANKNEGNSGTTLFTFTVTRTGNLTGTPTVKYTVKGVGANPATANDFTGSALPNGVITFEGSQTSKVISISVRGDASIEPTEYFRVTLSDATGGANIVTPTANGVIRNDDSSLAIAPTSANKNEGNSGITIFTFTVTRSGLLTGTTTVDYAVIGFGTSPATLNDFVGNVLPSGTVTFRRGETSKVISIRVRGDVTVEPNKAFRVTLSTPSQGASITTSIASGLIRNDDV